MSELFKEIELLDRSNMKDGELTAELVNQLCLGQALGGYGIAAVLFDWLADAEGDMGDSLDQALCAMANGSGADKHSDTIIEILTEWCEAKIAEYREWKQEQAEAL
jgi:hypothetical protein